MHSLLCLPPHFFHRVYRWVRVCFLMIVAFNQEQSSSIHYLLPVPALIQIPTTRTSAYSCVSTCLIFHSQVIARGKRGLEGTVGYAYSSSCWLSSAGTGWPSPCTQHSGGGGCRDEICLIVIFPVTVMNWSESCIGKGLGRDCNLHHSITTEHQRSLLSCGVS